MSESSVVNEICADIEDRLEGLANFVLVVWLDDRPGDPKAVCVASPPSAHHQVATALATAITVLGKP